MSLTSLTFTGGLALGLASSLHCLGMCGGIASALFLAGAPDGGNGARLRTFGLIQLGKGLSYAAMGALVAAFGAVLLTRFDSPTLYLLLRSGAALSLGWIGLTLTGFAPPLGLLDRLFLAISRGFERLRRALPLGGVLAPLVAGMGWGFVPCGMVYGTLVFAMAAGKASAGAAVMAGFALGTVPALTATVLGIGSLRRLGENQRLQVFAGLVLIALAAASVLIPLSTIAALCGEPLTA